MSDNKKITYVVDGEEVIKTGREAIRTAPGPRGNREYRVVEVTPIADFGLWKKWVDPSELYEVLPSTKDEA